MPALTDNDCLNKDLNSDGHIDGTDYALFQQCMSGCGNPAPPSCACGTSPNGTFTK